MIAFHCLVHFHYFQPLELKAVSLIINNKEQPMVCWCGVTNEKGVKEINVQQENKRHRIWGTCLSVFSLHCSCCLILYGNTVSVRFMLCLDMVHLHANGMQELEIVFCLNKIMFVLCIQNELLLYCAEKQLPRSNHIG